MDVGSRVLILGGTGRTGGRVVAELLGREVPVLALVRSADRLPGGVRGNALLGVVEATALDLSAGQLAGYLEGCETVISCLGHTVSVKGVLGPPHYLVEEAVRAVRSASAICSGTRPVRLILMSSVSVNQPDHQDTHRGRGERAALWLIRGLMPPSRDNQRAADFLTHEVGAADPQIDWVVVRPDTLREGDLGQYQVSAELVSSIFRPANTRMAQVAHFMAELATDDPTWQRWRGQMLAIVDTTPEATRRPASSADVR